MVNLEYTRNSIVYYIFPASLTRDQIYSKTAWKLVICCVLSMQTVTFMVHIIIDLAITVH
jgi:hypothetical protein